MTDPQVLHTAEEIASWADEIHARGETIALVPTMGNLHRGHLSLVDIASAEADYVVVSIFVNPTQFGEGEDFDRYPRTLESDYDSLAGRGVTVFAPSVDEIYPPDSPVEQILAGPVGDVLEGAVRPGHFDGVLTVCNRLFELSACDVAVFGEKDAQQLFLVTDMVRRNRPGLRIVPGPIIRADDGLALSSRNAYLSANDRRSALALSAALNFIATEVNRGVQVREAVEAGQLALAREPALELDYLEALDAESFGPWSDDSAGECVVVGAIVVGGTRLLDNTRLTP
jgi:pantoate--beta-alanine ligase